MVTYSYYLIPVSSYDLENSDKVRISAPLDPKYASP
jgi:hypothetical protein